MYQPRYKSFVLWLAVGLIGLVALFLLVGVALADTGKEMRYTSDREISQDTPTPTATNYLDFVIWGNVRDENGNPVAGVRVEAADKWYYTDAQGWYSFVHLSAGTYVVSPSYGNASFSPPSRTITVPPSVGYMDFQMLSATSTPASPTPTATPVSTPLTPTPTPTPTPVVGDSGFQPNPNGWQFTNLGYETTWGNFRDIFGADQVEWNIGGLVVRDPGAQIYFLRVDYGTWGERGQCYGMVTTAALRFHNKIALPGGVTVNNLFNVPKPPTKVGNADVMVSSPVADYLVKYNGYQLGYQQQKQYDIAEQRSLTQTLALMKASVDNHLESPYTFWMRGSDKSNGNTCIDHTMLPFSYIESNGVTTFEVYNPNREGQTHIVTINAKSGTWDYNSEPQWGNQNSNGVCVVGHDSFKSFLRAIPLGLNTMRPERTWYRNSGVMASGTQAEVSELTQLFVNSGNMVTISGATYDLQMPIGGLPYDGYPLHYLIDGGAPFTVTVEQMVEGQAVEVTIFDSKAIVALQGQSVPGVKDTLVFSPGAEVTTLQTSGTVTRSLTFITNNIENTYQVDLPSIALTDGSAQMKVGSSGAISLTATTDQTDYLAHFFQVGNSSTTEFTLAIPSLVTGDTHLLQPNWSNDSVVVLVDTNSDGSINHQEIIQTTKLLKIFLPLIQQ